MYKAWQGFLGIGITLVVSGCGETFTPQKNEGNVSVLGNVHDIGGDKASVEELGSLSVAGSATLRNKSFERLTVNGSAQLQDVVVRSKATINGSLDIRGGNFENLDVNGSANLQKTSVHALMHINGGLHAYEGTFDAISIATTDMELSNCTVDTILVRRSDPWKEQVIRLVDSVVNKDITFEQGNGKVIANKKSVIKGKIIGGLLEQ